MGPDASDVLFEPNHVLEVQITMAPEDWAALRAQPDVIGFPKATCADPSVEGAYTYFMGEISIDGETFSDVGIRKKGGFGSITSGRPGLKIKPGEFMPGERIFGLSRLTLNNNHQDASRISQCLGYQLFRDAGVPAPRCSFAHVTVNGEDLGIYSNVESIKKSFLRRHFADDSGRLYESGGDFVSGSTVGYQPKTDRRMPDCSDLPPVVTALASPDSELLASLDAVVDVDAFTTYWAMEVLTDHWDGYANNRNNHFFYHDPSSDRFHFIPWGIDALFTGRQRSTRPNSVFACGSMAHRLYSAPETRDAYLARLRELLDTVWDETAIVAEISRMEALITPFAYPGSAESLAPEIQRTRDFVTTRRGVLLDELDAGTPVWPFESGDESCRIVIGTIDATFDTSWDSLDDFTAGTATTGGDVAGVALMSATGTSNSGLGDDGKPIVQIFGQLPDGRLAVVVVIVQNSAELVPGTMAIDLVNVAALMVFYDPETDTASGGGLILGGSLTLTAASSEAGAPIIGSVSGSVLEL